MCVNGCSFINIVFIHQLDSSKSGLFPHLITCSGMYHNMEVIVATLEYKQAGISTIIMSELAQLRLERLCFIMINVPHFSVP